MSNLRIYVLGSPRVEIDESALDVDTRKATALLIYLALSDRPIDRSRLVDMFWPTYPAQRRARISDGRCRCSALHSPANGYKSLEASSTWTEMPICGSIWSPFGIYLASSVSRTLTLPLESRC